MTPIALDHLRVTKGSIRAATIRDPVVRAQARDGDGDAAELCFTFAGPCAEPVRLASGELRMQLGLKLRAANSCNVIYVMWAVGSASLAVSIKHNPGMRSHAECGARGYLAVAADSAAAIAPLAIGGSHVMRAEIARETLTAWIDNALAWTGALPAAARAFSGPAGLRTDNVQLDDVGFSRGER